MTETEPAEHHLQDAVLHLKRACLALKSAAQADPGLLTRLGTPHATLQARGQRSECPVSAVSEVSDIASRSTRPRAL